MGIDRSNRVHELQIAETSIVAGANTWWGIGDAYCRGELGDAY